MKGKKILFKCILAVLLSFCCANLVAFFYNHDAKWMPRTGGATKGVYAPGHFNFRSDEGFGYEFVDKNGYFNGSSELADDYILVYGKSHTNALEVLPGERYVDILNDRMAVDDKTKVYSVARGDTSFADMICGFKALIAEFPESSAVIMEITYVGTDDEFTKAMEQRPFSADDRASFLLANQSPKQVFAGLIKEWFPLVAYFVNYQWPRLSIFDKNCFFQAELNHHIPGHEENIGNNNSYKSLNNALKLIRSEYDGRIIILYHPDVFIDKNGAMRTTVDDGYDELTVYCKDNDIEVCDVTDAFIDQYAIDHSVPYGFANTSMGQGHLNKIGHRIIADKLYGYFEGNR